jgi:CheY-like chemotaxis protein
MPVLLNLNDVVEDMRAMLPRLLGEHIALVVTPAKRLGTVLVDRGQIEQVILNLAVNARNAMPDGGTLTIETRDVEFRDAYTGEFRSAPPGHYVMLAVGDTGAGMDEATRTKIFEPFFTTKEQGRGTGLGLSTVDGIIGQSGGSIRVYSEPGHGTTFKVYLPRCEEQVCPNQPEPARAAMLGTETVLLVEDEVTIGLFASRLLRSAGYTVLTVGSAEEALALLEQPKQRVHLLLTDVVLPGMSGLKLATQIGPAHPEIKILYMSGYTDDATLRLSVRHQVTHFLGKPFTAAELMRKVREALDSPR